MLRSLIFIFAVTFIAGCGEAIFYQDIRLIQSSSNIDLHSIINKTASELGYIQASDNLNKYRNQKSGYLFQVSINNQNSFEISFESFGVPDRQEKARDELATALKKVCAICTVSVKDRSVWGFIDEDSGWKPF